MDYFGHTGDLIYRILVSQEEKGMKGLLFASLLIALSAPVQADLGPKFHTVPSSPFLISEGSLGEEEGFGEAEDAMADKTFDVWCSKRNNKCTVDFIGDRIVVNKKGGVKRSQVIRIWRDKELRTFMDRNPMSYYQDAFYVTYKKSDGKESTGKFIILHKNTASSFWNRLQSFMGSERREVGPNLQIEMLE